MGKKASKKRDEASSSKKEEDIAVKSWIRPQHIVLAILVLAFAVRIYHFDYPVVGYHNWKETHYLTEGRNFAREGFFKHGFFIPAHDLPGFNDDPSGAHNDTFPITSIILGILFMIFGPSLAIARLVGITFSVATVYFLYLLARNLFKREDVAIVTAAVAAINPLMVFFSHNAQLDSPALFLAVVSAYYFTRFYESLKPKDLILTSLFLTLSVMTRYDFVLLGFPMLFSLVFKVLSDRKRGIEMLRKSAWAFAVAAMIFSSVFLWLAYTDSLREKYIGPGSEAEISGFALIKVISLDVFFTQAFWQTMKYFVADNFTLLGMSLAIVGAILVIVLLRKGFGNQFMFYYIIGALAWTIVLSSKLMGHNYHQFPLVPLVSILIAYMLVVVGSTVARYVRFEGVKWLFVAAMLIVLFSQSKESWGRMFDTQFIGLDVAGDYIRTHSSPGETLFHSSHQSYGVLWHADRKGYKPTSTPEGFRKGEDEKGIRWFFVYEWQLPKVISNQDLWNYLQSNYTPVQMAFTQNGGQPSIKYILLRKGGSFDGRSLNDMVNSFVTGKQMKTKTYEYTKGEQALVYFEEQ